MIKMIKIIRYDFKLNFNFHVFVVVSVIGDQKPMAHQDLIVGLSTQDLGSGSDADWEIRFKDHFASTRP